MNRLTIIRVFFALVCLCDVFTLYVFYRLGFSLGYVVLFPMVLVLALAKYPVYEICFSTINRKYIEYSITGVLCSIAFNAVTGISIVAAITSFGVFSILKISALFVIVCFELFFVFCLVVMKNMFVLDISVPSSFGKVNL